MKHEAFVPARLLPLESLCNVRDLGGYKAGEGRQVKWGMLYRGGDLHTISPQDQIFLEKRHIKTIVDFRGEREKQQAPDGVLGTVVHRYELPIEAGNMLDLTKIETGVSGEALMEELYCILVTAACPQYQEFFKILANPENIPLLFHCSAGKDRTGLGTALILTALGVEREIVYQDYMLSAEYLKEKFKDWITIDPHLEPVLTIRQSYLEAAFNTIDSTFGNINRYLQEILGTDPGLLKHLYTE